MSGDPTRIATAPPSDAWLWCSHQARCRTARTWRRQQINILQAARHYQPAAATADHHLREELQGLQVGPLVVKLVQSGTAQVRIRLQLSRDVKTPACQGPVDSRALADGEAGRLLCLGDAQLLGAT